MWRALLTPVVLVSALGYFVDIYDLVVFSIVRVASLRSLGLGDVEIFSEGLKLFDVQLAGMLLGGFFWGILADRKGRVGVLYASILMYSAANLANAFVTNLPAYFGLRFLAGFGLAGELGVAITLVSESLPRDLRGYGTAIVAAVGISGGLLAGTVAHAFSWRVTYGVGGALGLLLLVARVRTMESSLFHRLEAGPEKVVRGSLRVLFASGERVRRFFACAAVGVPIWFVLGILLSFGPEVTRELGVVGTLDVGWAVMLMYGGAAVGDLASGALSQRLRSRNRVIGIFLGLTALLVAVYFSLAGVPVSRFYALYLVLGVTTGYWAVFVTIAAEQFGTNLRATVATTLPNLVRASVIPLTWLLKLLQPSWGLRFAAAALFALCTLVAFISLRSLSETFGRDLEFVER